MKKFIHLSEAVRIVNDAKYFGIIRLGTFALPNARFDHIHIDFISLLLSSEGHQYCMTITTDLPIWWKQYQLHICQHLLQELTSILEAPRKRTAACSPTE